MIQLTRDTAMSILIVIGIALALLGTAFLWQQLTIDKFNELRSADGFKALTVTRIDKAKDDRYCAHHVGKEDGDTIFIYRAPCGQFDAGDNALIINATKRKQGL